MAHAAAKHREGRLRCEPITGMPARRVGAAGPPDRGRLGRSPCRQPVAPARHAPARPAPADFRRRRPAGGLCRRMRHLPGRNLAGVAATTSVDILARLCSRRRFSPFSCRRSAERFLAERLLLPSLPAWWLGDAETRWMLAARPSRFCLRDAFNPHSPSVPVADLTSADRRRLQASIGEAPKNFVTVLNLRLRAHHRAVVGDTAAIFRTLKF